MKKYNNTNQWILKIFLCIISLLILFPFLLVLSISLSNETDIVNAGYKLIPMHFDLAAYMYVFTNPKAIYDAYKVTIIYSTVTMVLATLLTAMIAYPLSKKKLIGRKEISLYIYFTMLFSGGLVPTYILISKYLQMNDSIWVYIIPGLISPWFVFMMRSFFQGLPEEISESALIDGANEYIIFFKMILPLSKPVLATVALLTFLGKWNDWFTAMLYINKEELISLQYLLQRIIQNIALLQDNNINNGTMVNVHDIPAETVRMAMAVVVAGPAMLVFPFFQKYFVKGLTVGSVKG